MTFEGPIPFWKIVYTKMKQLYEEKTLATEQKRTFILRVIAYQKLCSTKLLVALWDIFYNCVNLASATSVL